MKFFRAKYPAIWQINVKFDPSMLLKEFERIYADRYEKIYSKNNSWKGVTIFSHGSRLELDELPELESLANNFGKENILGISYFNLETNSTLHEHRDMNGNLFFGVVRVHVPLKTNDQAFMFIEKVKYHLPLGTAWALDTSGLHALANGALSNRIHLVIDIKKSPKTLEYFPDYTLSVILHLFKFSFIVSFKILRDLFSNPKSLIKRIKTLTKKYMK